MEKGTLPGGDGVAHRQGSRDEGRGSRTRGGGVRAQKGPPGLGCCAPGRRKVPERLACAQLYK